MADENETPSGISWQKVHELPIKCTFTNFLESLQVWIDKPHVVNRRLSGSLVIKRAWLDGATSCEELVRLVMSDLIIIATDMSSKIDKISITGATTEEDHSNDKEGCVEVILRRLLPRLIGKNDKLVELVFIDKREKEISFIPVCMEKPQESTSSDDKHGVGDNSKMVPYKISYLELADEQTRISLHISESVLQSCVADNKVGDGVVCPSIKWLKDQLLPKLKKWAENPEKSSKGSLRLISLEKYTVLYQMLKEKYGLYLVKEWPESTDPQKFVFEDIAIATYLIVLWEAERERKKLKEKQSFVDLGCGNGLLVYILCKEGYPGSGIDVRKRKIWELYGPGIQLEEKPLDPTAPGLYPKVDWMIGNHSDELTPWLPVIAARSSYNTRYFVLPCCLYDFNCKFVRKDNKSSQYRGYLDFVSHVGVSCGFEVEEDMLRIPSTKRVCQVGQCRTYPEEEQQNMDVRIKMLIRERGCDIDQGQRPQTLCALKTSSMSDTEGHLTLGNHGPKIEDNEPDGTRSTSLDSEIELDGTGASVEDRSLVNETGSPPCKRPTLSIQTKTAAKSSTVFQPREHTIEIRNCSHLSKSLKEFIVNSVVKALLRKDPCKSEEDCMTVDSDRLTSTGKPVSMWKKGGSMTLPDIAKLFDKETLKKLKNECGGIQTLLRNHHYIFKVVRGVVQLRDWTQELPGPKLTNGNPEYLKRRYEALRNTSLCWFHLNHPDGCVLPTEHCPYAHHEDELVDRPSQEYLKSL